MKRLHIITKPTTVDELAGLNSDNFGGEWDLRAERLEAKRLRKFKQQMS